MVEMIIIFLSCLFYVLAIYAIHELGHILAIAFTGGRVVGLTVGWRGVGVKWSGDADPRKQIAVSLSGPVANLIVFAMCGFSLFGLCNLVFGILNLLFPGGDGAKVIKLIRREL